MGVLVTLAKIGKHNTLNMRSEKMSEVVDLIGLRFGRLTVVERASNSKKWQGEMEVRLRLWDF